MLEQEVFSLYPEYNIIHGPYTRMRDNRKTVVLYNNKTFQKKTISYSKLLLEIKLGRKLILDETCDHIDNDCTNDKADNLQILLRADNVRKANPCKLSNIICLCGKEFLPKRKEQRFCSNHCRYLYTPRRNQYT